jgi:hypothetical protein
MITNIMIYIIILVIILIIFILLLCKNKIENFKNIDIQFDEYKNIMFKNDGKKLYKVELNDNINILEEDCYDKCDHTDCVKLYNKKKILKECLKCNIQKNKCYNKSIIGGNCDDCDIENIEDKLDCYDISNFGCPNPKNISYNKGIDPYYIEVNDNNINSPYSKKCIFCWSILDNI